MDVAFTVNKKRPKGFVYASVLKDLDGIPEVPNELFVDSSDSEEEDLYEIIFNLERQLAAYKKEQVEIELPKDNSVLVFCILMQ
jgi:hypothetical protein